MQVELPTSLFRETTAEVVREVAADAPSIFGIGLDTALGVAAGGGGVAAAVGAFKLLKVILSKDRKPEGGGAQPNEPFPRRLDEARQLREIRQYTERRVPEYDAAVGRIVEAALALARKTQPVAQRAVLEEFWLRIRDRVDRLMPPSTREYHESR